MSRELLVLRLEQACPMSDTPLEIWIDPANGIWCIGPPRAATSDALLLMQTRPSQFFIAPPQAP